MSDRWFIALWPDPAVREAILRQCRPLVPESSRAVHPLDWHLTLVFLGELDARILAGVEAVVAALLPGELAFDLSLDRIGVFRRPGILWCGPSRCPESLARLVDRLRAGIAPLGIGPEERPFCPHVTLARKVRVLGPVDPSLGPLGSLDRPLIWPVSEIVLASGRQGRIPRYAIRRRWPLGPCGG